MTIHCKYCTSCGRYRLEKEFHKTSRRYNMEVLYEYKHSKCKDCRNEEKKKWNKRNTAKIAAYNRKKYQERKDERKRRLD